MNRPNRKRGKEFPRKKQPPGQEPVVGKELPGGTKKGQDDTVPSRRGRGRMRRCGKKAPTKKGSSGNCGESGDKISPFISLFAQRNEPKKGHPCHWSRRRRDARSLCPAWGTPRCCRGFANSLRSNSANPLFGSLSGARLRANGNFPHLSCRASQTRAEKDAGTV